MLRHPCRTAIRCVEGRASACSAGSMPRGACHIDQPGVSYAEGDGLYSATGGLNLLGYHAAGGLIHDSGMFNESSLVAHLAPIRVARRASTGPGTAWYLYAPRGDRSNNEDGDDEYDGLYCFFSTDQCRCKTIGDGGTHGAGCCLLPYRAANGNGPTPPARKQTLIRAGQ